MSLRVAALIPAAGSGERLGLGPKALVEVGGRSLLERAVHALSPYASEVLVALPSGMGLPVGVHGPSVVEPGVQVVAGGLTRQESVLNLLRGTDADVVLVHDAARPFVPGRVVRELLAAASRSGGATAAIPCADTLVRADAGSADAADWGELVDRAGVWAVQTPQAFVRDVLLSAHERAVAAGWAATDDAGLVVRAGGKVRLVRGDTRLFKVTTPADLALARALAPVWDATLEDEA